MDDASLTQWILGFLGELDGFTYRATGPAYTAEEAAGVVLFYGALKPTPDRAVAVRVYGPQDAPDVRVRRVQLRARGAAGVLDDADRIADAAHDAIRSITRTTFGGGVLGAVRLSFLPLGPDDGRREGRTENYIITLDNEEALL